MGFDLSSATSRNLIIVFVIYSAMIIFLGLYVKRSGKKESANQKLRNFLTGGGNMGPVAIGMLIFTGMSSAGCAVGGPGTGYSQGFIWSVAVWTGFAFGGMVPLIVGKKMAIVSKRTGAVSIVSLLRHRFGGSKAYAILLAACFVAFLGAQTVGQFSGGGRVFAVVSGTGNYQIGVMIIAAVTVIYTVTGGIKSIGKVAVVQGFLMITTVIVMYIAVLANVSRRYGSLEQMADWLAQNNAQLMAADTWQPLYMAGTAILMCDIAIALPTGLVSGFTYNKSSALMKGAIIAIICTTVYQFIMSGLGPFTYAMNQNLASGDYATVFLATSVLPDIMAGIVVAGVASAIQSTIATLLIIVTGSLVIDVYKNVFHPEAEAEKLTKMNRVVTVIFGLVCVLIALYPSEMIQMFINFASGGLAAAIFLPILFGFFSKRATTAGAVGSTIGGAAVYGVCYLLSVLEPTREWWGTSMGNMYPVIPAVIAALIIMLICNRVFRPVELGRLQVWFCKDYDEEWADISRKG